MRTSNELLNNEDRYCIVGYEQASILYAENMIEIPQVPINDEENINVMELQKNQSRICGLLILGFAEFILFKADTDELAEKIAYHLIPTEIYNTGDESRTVKYYVCEMPGDAKINDIYYDGDYDNCREIMMNYRDMEPILIPDKCTGKSHEWSNVGYFYNEGYDYTKVLVYCKHEFCKTAKIIANPHQDNLPAHINKYVQLSNRDVKYKDECEKL